MAIGALALALTISALPAAAQISSLSIPATTLDRSLLILSRQAGVEIVSTEHGLARIRTPALSGSMRVEVALAQLLEGTGYSAVKADGGYRIVRARGAAKVERARGRQRTSVARPDTEPAGDIVVTATKQRVPLLRYPGSITTVLAADVPAPTGTSLSDIARAAPILQSTELGAGRNKIFIRGVADSSFNGSTQSPTSVYLDDVQLNYSGPDVGLRLYDMRNVEVLEGPQGTLYGSGAIGGVIRLTTNSPDFERISGATIAGATLTQGGAAGFDVAGVLNIPLVSRRLGLRAVGYRVRDGGYIDDAMRNTRDINRSDTIGGRLALRLDPGDGWRVDIGTAIQTIDTLDGQYSDVSDRRYTRRSFAAQPFHGNLHFGRVTVTKNWDSGLQLVAATGLVSDNSVEQFDATPRTIGPPPAPIRYRAVRSKSLISQETRLSHSLEDGNSWVVGFTLVRDRNILARALEASMLEQTIIGVTNVSRAASVFGEASHALRGNLSITLGARATVARTDGEPSSTPRSTGFTKGRSTSRLDPTIALSWQIAPDVAIFARAQTGYRTGGLAVAPGVGRISDYVSDAIRVGEIGIRKLRRGSTGLALSADFSLAHWNNIQADLITRRGQPHTTNNGDARIQALEGSIDWIPFAGLQATGAFLFTANRVRGPAADLSTRNNRRLPETPPFAGAAGLSYTFQAAGFIPRIGATARYVGRSVLGTGDLLDISQGRYWTVGVTGSARIGKFEMSFDVQNLTNSKANQFAFGNPFSFSLRDQVTPLRPRSVRVGISMDL